MHDTKYMVQQFLSMVRNRDFDIAELFAEEIDWFVPGEGILPWAGRLTHRAQIIPFFRSLWACTVPEKSQVIASTVLIDGIHAAIFGHVSHVAATTGVSFNLDMGFHLKVEKGNITYLRVYEDPTIVARAVGLL